MTADRSRVPTGEELDQARAKSQPHGLARFFKRASRYKVREGVGESKSVAVVQPAGRVPPKSTDPVSESGRPVVRVISAPKPRPPVQQDQTKPGDLASGHQYPTEAPPQSLPSASKVEPTSAAPDPVRPTPHSVATSAVAPSSSPEPQRPTILRWRSKSQTDGPAAPPVASASQGRRPIKIAQVTRDDRGGVASEVVDLNPAEEWKPTWRSGMTMAEIRKKIGPTQNYMEGG